MVNNGEFMASEDIYTVDVSNKDSNEKESGTNLPSKKKGNKKKGRLCCTATTKKKGLPADDTVEVNLKDGFEDYYIF